MNCNLNVESVRLWNKCLHFGLLKSNTSPIMVYCFTSLQAGMGLSFDGALSQWVELTGGNGPMPCLIHPDSCAIGVLKLVWIDR